MSASGHVSDAPTPPAEDTFAALLGNVFEGSPFGCERISQGSSLDIAKTIRAIPFKWQLSEQVEGVATALVPGSITELDSHLCLMLQCAIGVASVDPLPNETMARPAALPHLILPVIIDACLLDLADCIFAPQGNDGPAYRLWTNDGNLSSKHLFEHLFGAFDAFHSTLTDVANAAEARQRTPHLPTPIAEPLMAALLREDHFGSLFNTEKLLSVNSLDGDVDYWQRTKSANGADLQASGDNPFFARFCAGLRESLKDAAGEANRLGIFLAGMNLMLVVRAGSTGRMAFPLSIIVYQRMFFPFAEQVLGRFTSSTGVIWRQQGVSTACAEFLNWREHLRYCRLTQYTQADISFVGDPEKKGQSQTARALAQGLFYSCAVDNVAERKQQQAAGQEIDEELGIRSLFYIRLFPPGASDISHDSNEANIYLFGYSPFSHWFTSDEDRIRDLGLRLQRRISPLRGVVQSMGHSEIVNREKIRYIFGRVRAVAKKESAIDLATKLTHQLWWKILLNYHVSDTSLHEIIAAWMRSGDGKYISGKLPEFWRGYEADLNFEVRVDVDCIVRLLGEIWNNCSHHGNDMKAELHTGSLVAKYGAFIAIQNELKDRKVPSLQKYLHLRQRIPMSRPNPENAAVPRGFFLLLTHLAFETIATIPDHEGSESTRISLTYGLKRSSVTVDEETNATFSVRPVRQSANESLSCVPIEELWSHWELKVCFDQNLNS